MTALTRMLHALTAMPGRDVFLTQVLATIREQLTSRCILLWFHDARQDTLSLHMACDRSQILSAERSNHPCASEVLSARDIPWWQEMVHARQPVVITDLAGQRCLPDRKWLLAQGVRTLLLVPLLLGEEAIGWLTICRDERRRFDPEEIELAQALAQQATLAVQLTRLAEPGARGGLLLNTALEKK